MHILSWLEFSYYGFLPAAGIKSLYFMYSFIAHPTVRKRACIYQVLCFSSLPAINRPTCSYTVKCPPPPTPRANQCQDTFCLFNLTAGILLGN